MRVPQFLSPDGAVQRVRRGSLLLLLALIAGFASARAAGVEHKQAPAYQLSLQALGYAGSSQAALDAGSSVLTLNSLDDSHVLLTFNLRKLVPRLPNDPPTDEDRLVAAEVVDLPSGKIEARTEWHLHDHARYLWSLGKGRFVLRIGQQLYALAPLANLATAEPFLLTRFPNRGAGLKMLVVSPDGGIVTEENAANPHPQVILGDATPEGDQQVVVDFFRIRGDGSSSSPMEVEDAGRAVAAEPIFVALDADGYLWGKETSAGQWTLGFESFVTRGVDLGTILSSCAPRLEMVSPSEYVALTCMGADDHIKIASYGLDGHETWEEGLGDYGPPTFVHAFGAGRFGVSHSTLSSGAVTASGLPEEAPVTHQDIRVYQNASGDLLLKVDCVPAYKTAENFDLSEDGSQLVVAQGGNLAVYTLPPLSKQDRADMAEVAKFAPPAGSGPVLLTRLTRGPDASEKASAVPAAEQPVTLPAPSPVLPAPAATPTETASGDEQEQTSPRKPPTLLNPGEKAEMQPKQKSN